MKFPWLSTGNDVKTGLPVLAPMLPVGFKRDGKYMPLNPTILVDTGAHGTVLNISHAANLGFSAADLVEETYDAAGGPASFWAPKEPGLLEIRIGTGWHPLPTLKFGLSRVSLLGRDAIFSRFELRMTPTEFEFIPIAKKA
jgi:hypothetical protein